MDEEEEKERRDDEKKLELIEDAFNGRLVIGVPREGQEHEEDEEEEAEMKRESGLRVGICGGGASVGSHGRRLESFFRRFRDWSLIIWSFLYIYI